MIWLLIVMMLQAPVAPTVPFLPSPTPIPSSTPVPTPSGEEELFTGQVLNYVRTGVAIVNGLPDDITAPGGVELIADEDATTIFSYAKWLFSGASTQELFGQRLNVFPNRLFIYFVLVVTLELIWFFLNPLGLILKGLPFILQIAARLFLGSKGI